MLYYFILHSHFYTNPIPLPVGLSMGVMDVGWGNGYVLIPPGHTFHGKNYDNIEAFVHGGLTFGSMYKGWNQLKKYKDSGFKYQMDEELSKRIKKEGYKFLDNYWCIGFDTAHFGDDLTTCPKEYVWNETQILYKLCFDADIKTIRRAKLNKIKNKDVR